MKQFLITPNDLLKFMKEEDYDAFINYLVNENNIPKDAPIWIIGEWSASNEEKE